ncbi:T9SS type A sorting domain-containing protein [Nonlabens xiamenensis]|uniref:T9SS type A sorting domain-containing protein n=1 Tax=Nonlabens xiamenensis TaxID=2341043 RepID=UPI000F604C45|nr:T9SS type A sorting domain-containing protein [Nonlabens xiamenensis]
MKKSLLIITFLLSLCGSAQTVIYVDASATGANNGSSWANAYTSLATATSNHSNTQIWIAAGTYSPGPAVSDRIRCTSNTELYGGFNGTEAVLTQRDWIDNPTIIDGDVNGDDTGSLSYTNSTKTDNNYRLLQTAGPNIVYDGLILKNAAALGTTNSDKEGSAMIVQKDTQIRNCIFESNIAARGGTISVGGPITGATIRVTNSQFKNNLAAFANAFYSDRDDVKLVIANSLINDNTNSSSSGVSGAGNLFWFRTGGNGENSLTMTNCTVTNNTYSNNASAQGHIRVDGILNDGDYKFYNNIFYGNQVNYNVIVLTNNASPDLIDVQNNIDEDAFSNIANNGSSRINLNNIAANPLFIDTAMQNYRLGINSPAINSGDINLYAASFPNIDLDGNGRFAGTSIDRGCYESSSTQGPSRPIVYVNPNASGSNDGTSWTNAYTDLQTAFLNAQGKEVWIASGTYIRPSNASKNYVWEIFTNTSIYGGFDGTETMLNQRDYIANPTILSGDFNGDDNTNMDYSVGAATKTDNNLRVAIVRGSNVEIDGITFTGGHAFSLGILQGAALAIAIDTKVSNCVFDNNTAERGGAGVLVYDTNGLNSGTTRFTNCIFKRNRAWFASAIYVETNRNTYKLELLGCSFEQNNTGTTTQPNNPAGIVWLRNQAASNVNSDFDAINCTIAGNTGTHNDSRYTHFHLTKLLGNSEYRGFNNIFYDNTQNLTNGSSPTPAFGVSGGSRNFTIDTNIDEHNFANLGTTALNTTTTAPGFINASTGDYRIMMGSVAAGSGNATLNSPDTPDQDYFGLLRNNNGWDIGAYSSLSTASTHDLTTVKASLYPNPASDIMNVELFNSAFAKAYIYNLQGQQVATSIEASIPVADLQAGMYLIKVETTDGATVSQKFVKR